MNSLTSIALSGLQGAQLRVASAGHNVANAMTPDFRRQLLNQQAAEGGGVASTIGRAPTAGDALAEDLVELKLGEHLCKANLQVLRAHDRMLGSLLDETA
ncbi:MAG TPA: flagellar basal body rod protein [Burkholderiaceae bacterium]|nr:flagellar basal body rod protein [Burkholderiaceae bacterium]HSC00316.1 flagellar basal body rod protein [Burkholderiaceae bacterium]